MVASWLLKDHFEKIMLLERQSKESFLQKHGFTFPIVFTPASIKILQRIGVWEEIKSERSEFFGVVIRKRLMGKEFKIVSAQEGVYSHWRNHIIAKLYERVVAANIDIHFNARVEDIDFARNECQEAALGTLPFDLLIGADGIYSFTRGLLAKAHPIFAEEDFSLTFLDEWYAYRLPARGALKEKFGGGDRFHAFNIFVDNLATAPATKFRIATTSMRQPSEKISILVKHEAGLGPQRLKELNDSYFGQFFDSMEELHAEWDAGVAGKFDQVKAPTFSLNSVLLLGDAAHGFESAGDLINMGITSTASFLEILDKHESIPEALRQYDETIGESLRFYADFSLRRSKESISFEVASIEFAARLGLANRHPSLFGIYQDDFEIQKYMRAYQRDILVGKLLAFSIPVALLFLKKFMRKRRE